MSARVHQMPFRAFAGPYAVGAETTKAAATIARPRARTWWRRLLERLTEVPHQTEIGRAYAYAYATATVPAYRSRAQ